MAFSVTPDSQPRAFRLLGELDLATADRLPELLELAMREDGDIHLDLSGLSFMDSSGVHALFRVCRTMGDRGRVVLHAPTGAVAKILSLVRADQQANLVIHGDGTRT